jgi:hypothetical protein
VVLACFGQGLVETLPSSLLLNIKLRLFDERIHSTLLLT